MAIIDTDDVPFPKQAAMSIAFNKLRFFKNIDMAGKTNFNGWRSLDCRWYFTSTSENLSMANLKFGI